jgi:CheY-like chemotaxis protein
MGERKILIIDDEADIRAVAQLSLQINQGWEVLTAESGRTGIAIAQESLPDAILLDVMMPDLDGPSTLKQLQVHPQTQKIPVIFLTAKVQATEQRYYAELGVKAVLTKPFDPVQLGDLVAQALGWT